MIAGLVAFEWSRKRFYYYAGFDPEWSRYSVGTVLLSRCIEDGIDRGIEEFDFMRGRAAYKMKWKINERPFYRVVIARGWINYWAYRYKAGTARMKKKWKQFGSLGKNKRK